MHSSHRIDWTKRTSTLKACWSFYKHAQCIKEHLWILYSQRWTLPTPLPARTSSHLTVALVGLIEILKMTLVYEWITRLYFYFFILGSNSCSISLFCASSITNIQLLRKRELWFMTKRNLHVWRKQLRWLRRVVKRASWTPSWGGGSGTPDRGCRVELHIFRLLPSCGTVLKIQELSVTLCRTRPVDHEWLIKKCKRFLNK